MSRLARVVIPGYPHHITQRGARRMKTFFTDTDYMLYISLLQAECRKNEVEIWAYCLMPNHVHMIAVPGSREALRKCFGAAHRKYALLINKREDWRGHLWQERFSSFIMDYPHLVMASRYIEMNPVRASLVDDPAKWPWSSAAAHLSGCDDRLVCAPGCCWTK